MDKAVILITGGSGKVGRHLIHHFLTKKMTVITTSRTQAKINELKHDFAHPNFYTIKVDLEKQKSSQKVLDYLEQHQLQPTVLVNNARNVKYLSTLDDLNIDRQNWLGEFLLDVVVAHELTVKLSCWSKTKLRSVINIASMYGVVAVNPHLYPPGQAPSPIHYSVAKAALIHLTKELAVRLAPRNIRVNAVSFGGIEGRVSAEFKKKYAELCPQGSMLQDQDVVGAVDFLASAAASRMTGHNLVVDGGWSIW